MRENTRMSTVEGRPKGWAEQAVIAGFAATAAFTVVVAIAYGVARTAGQSAHSTNVLGQWFYGLTNNSIVSRANDGLYAALLLNIVVGVGWAIVYAYAFEPRLRGTPMQRGLTFAILPFVLSVVVLFPLLQGGVLGFGLGGGPLPLLGNAVIHAVYGLVLGRIYALDALGLTDANGSEIRANGPVERWLALGLVGGAIVGGLIGMLIGIASNGDSSAVITGPWQTFLIGSVLGAVAGGLIGSMSQIGRLGTEHES